MRGQDKSGGRRMEKVRNVHMNWFMPPITFKRSSNKDKNMDCLIRYALDEIKKARIQANIIRVGIKPVRGCLGCMKHPTKLWRCSLVMSQVAPGG
jgi:hypothetical protein